MADFVDPRLDPSQIDSKSFASSFRGFDPTEVRSYLKSLADAIRASEQDGGRTKYPSGSVQPTAAGRDDEELSESLSEMTAERDELEAQLEKATTQLEKSKAKLGDTKAELAKTQAEMQAMAAKLSSAQRARDQATTSSVAGGAKGGRVAEESIDQLLGEETTRVLEAARQAAADIRAKAEVESQKRTDELDAAQRKVSEQLEADRKESDEDLAAAKAEADEIVSKLVSQAEADAEAATSAASDVAAAVKARAEEVAKETRMAAEAEADEATNEAGVARADAETDAARIRAEAEADAHTAADAAREEARLMLTEAQSMREKVLDDLLERRRLGRNQVDQAKAARDRLARALVAVHSQLNEATTELNIAVPQAKAAMQAVAAADKAGSPKSPSLGSLVDDPEDVSAAAATAKLDTELDGLFARMREAEGPEGAKPKAKKTKPVKGATAAAKADQSGEPASTGGVRTGDESTSEESAGEEIEVPPPFAARDMAVTRFGAGLRRQFKRALADDQGDVLDRLRRAGKKMSADALPDERAQVLRCVDAISESLASVANAGSVFGGAGAAAPKLIDELVERTAKALVQSMRPRLEAVVNEADDPEDALDPIRAQYREARQVTLPAIADDALAEAFAMGLYETFKASQTLTWMADPRVNPGPDCVGNTSVSVKKPKKFPSGHHRPLGAPGCRCLVVASR